MEILLLIGCAFGMLALLYFGVQMNKDRQEIKERVTGLTRASNAPAAKPMIRQKALEQSFTHRVILPMAMKLFERFQAIIPLSSKSFVRAKLMQAGYTRPKDIKQFLGIQILSTVALMGFMIAVGLLATWMPLPLTLFLIFGAGAVGYGFPLVWLIQQAQKRQESIQKSLADFIDLLVICVEAGLGLDMAINKIATLKSVRTSEFLREELQRYTKDIGFGKPRREALGDLAERIGLDDLTAVINALIQAYEMGTGVAHTLRVQSESLRVKRLQKAEEKANKIPVKMVLPIYIFLFPAIFVSIFGPIGMVMVKTVMDIFATMNGG